MGVEYDTLVNYLIYSLYELRVYMISLFNKTTFLQLARLVLSKSGLISFLSVSYNLCGFDIILIVLYM